MKLSARISAQSKQLWQHICRVDKRLEVAFYRMIGVIMLLLAPPLGLLALLVGMVIGTFITLYRLLKMAFNKPQPPTVNRSSDHG